MRILKETKAISILMLILLLLLFTIIGALISYIWVMSSFYNMPENATLLIVENVGFSTADFSNFNATILNPSNSIFDVNITAFRLSVETTNETYTLDKTEPEFPFQVSRGTRQSFKCLMNWSPLAGKTFKIEPVAANASTKSYSYSAPVVKLTLTPEFNANQSVEYFNLTIENAADSDINFTVSSILLQGSPVITVPALPYNLTTAQNQVFRCESNWENLRWVTTTVTANTTVGYESSFTTPELLGDYVYIDDTKFDYTDPTYFNVTIGNYEYSNWTTILSGVNVTLQGKAPFEINRTRSGLLLKNLQSALRLIPVNTSRTFECAWNWTEYRNENFTVNAYTEQGFTVYTRSMLTPPPIVWNITDLEFDLQDSGHFKVNVTNMPCSLQEINVSRVTLGEEEASTPSQIISAGEQKQFICSFDWKNLTGTSATITVYTTNGLNASKSITLPSIDLRIADSFTFDRSTGMPYVNVTVSNTAFSTKNATITQITFKTENTTDIIDGNLTAPQLFPDGYVLTIGANVTIVCPWNWVHYLNQNLTITIETAEGASATRTFNIP